MATEYEINRFAMALCVGVGQSMEDNEMEFTLTQIREYFINRSYAKESLALETYNQPDGLYVLVVEKRCQVLYQFRHVGNTWTLPISSDAKFKLLDASRL